MDFELAHYCNTLGAGTIDVVAGTVCAMWFLGLVWAGLLGAIWLFDRRRAPWVSLGVLLALLVELVVTEGVLKRVATYVVPMRLRPWVVHPGDIVAIGYRPQLSDSSRGRSS